MKLKDENGEDISRLEDKLKYLCKAWFENQNDKVFITVEKNFNLEELREKLKRNLWQKCTKFVRKLCKIYEKMVRNLGEIVRKL